MKTKTKLIALIAIMLSINLYGYGQPSSTNSPEPKWIVLKIENDIEVSYSKNKCWDSDAIFLKIENKSTNEVDVTWSLWSSAQPKTITISPGQVRKGICFNSPDFNLIDFLSPGQSEKTFSTTFKITPKI